MIFLSLLLLDLRGVSVPYVSAVVALSVMCVLLFLLHMCLLREFEGARVTAMLLWVMC